MTDGRAHPSEDQLLMAADDELDQADIQIIRAHLDSCSICRARLDEIRQTLTDFIHMRRNALNDQLPPIDDARHRLREEMARSVRQRVGDGAFTSKLFYAAAGVFLIAGVAFLTWRQVAGFEKQSSTPQSSLTPGDTVLTSRDNICRSNLENDPAPVPASLREAVFEEYGMTHVRAQDYELDYLITPKLGGATSLRNLWPEPYSAKWNARVKDQLEDRLHAMVCRGDIDIATAQREIATDWVAAYRKYFHTRQPLERQ
jgi:hypothetical protein